MTELPGATGALRSGPVQLDEAGLFTDFYELTMAAAYRAAGLNGRATFSLFVRRLPPNRSFLVAAGLEDVLDYLAAFRFTERATEYLRSLRMFSDDFLAWLPSVRFTGDVRAVPEGTLLFADEPLLEITAPIIEAQLVETAVINFCHLQTLLASKAARAVLAAGDRAVVEFGLRRAHGIDAGLKAARAAWIAGAAQTSNVLAGMIHGIPVTGTMAHSFVAAFETELDAFRAFATAFPDRTVLLLDTYDTVAAAALAVQIARELAARGHRLAGVRLDSGDVATLSRAVRDALDDAGLQDVRIFVSGNLDEDEIARLVAAGAPIDAFGVGTRMDTSADAPYLEIAYKLVRYEERDVLKLSPGKETWVGEKQVWRLCDAEGGMIGDLLGLRDEVPPDGAEPLLETVMREGRPLAPHPPLAAARARCAAQLAALPAAVRRLTGAAAYPVRISDALQARQRSARQDVAVGAGGRHTANR